MSGGTGELSIDLRAGTDVLSFTGAAAGGTFAAEFDGELKVQGGAGDDTLTLANLSVSDEVSIAGGAGANIIDVSAVSGSDISIRTDKGDDTITAAALTAEEGI